MKWKKENKIFSLVIILFLFCQVFFGIKNGNVDDVILYDEVFPLDSKIIYLTFDDGPGMYTKRILDVLEEYNVKATFFVTNQFPKYEYLIKNEYEKGHAIGVHTYSHNYKKIYSSFENYIDDVNKMNEIIKKYTGNFSNILRFPGGSSNTISRKYKKGIMTELTREVSNLGYTYFDWNVASGDVNGYSKNRIYKRIIKSLNDKPTIILMHDTKYNTLKVLPEIITYAKQNGYRFEVLSENSYNIHFKLRN